MLFVIPPFCVVIALGLLVAKALGEERFTWRGGLIVSSCLFAFGIGSWLIAVDLVQRM
jgi:hypothetical protein